MTEYLILINLQDNDWRALKTVFARSGRSAIQKSLEDTDSDYNLSIFSAVPARSWKPVTVKVETKTALKFS